MRSDLPEMACRLRISRRRPDVSTHDRAARRPPRIKHPSRIACSRSVRLSSAVRWNMVNLSESLFAPIGQRTLENAIGYLNSHPADRKLNTSVAGRSDRRAVQVEIAFQFRIEP